MQIYILDNDNDYMAYWFIDEVLGKKLMGRQTGQVELQKPEDLPLKMAPSFGQAKKQPTKLGDCHCFSGSRRLFSERAIKALSLESYGLLFPVLLEGREENFYWFWSTKVIDCLDESKTKRLGGSIQEPAFFEDRIGDVEIFTIPEDQKFQFNLYVTDSIRDKIKKAKLKGFELKTKKWPF